MSEKMPEPAPQGEPPKSEVTLEQLQEQLTQLRSTNERLLTESKDNKAKFQTTKEERDKLKEQEIERSNDLTAKVEHYKTEASKAKEDLVNVRTDILQERLKGAYRDVAPDCFEPEVVINSPEYLNDIKASLNHETLSIDRDVLKTVYAKDKERRSYLYGNKKLPSMVNGDAKPDVKKIDDSKPPADLNGQALVDHWVKKLENKGS